MKKKYILALDQGTSSSRAIVFNSDFQIVGLHQKEFKQIYLNDSWVEHDPEDIWQSQYLSALEAIRDANISPEEIASIGITNQRETTIIWDRNTGKPVYNAIVWMCRRTSSICSKLEEDGYKDMIREKTGLIIDPYFSGTKIKWLLDNIPGIRQRAEKGDLMFGTVDSWLLYRLTGNKEHKTDYTNASRTMLFNIKENRFDEELLKLLDIPGSLLPEVLPCNSIFGYTDPSLFGGVSIPIGGIAGDQHAALLGHGCIHEGMAKNTYGTGCFMLTNCGEKFVESKNGLLTTIAYNIDGKTIYALEGSIFNAGSTIQWLRDELQFFSDSKDSEYFAGKVKDSDGVYVVPAFSGLGAPYWDRYARGVIVGLTRNSNRNHITRAALESIAYQAEVVLETMESDSGEHIHTMEVDGGASANNLLMQFQADISDKTIVRPKNKEATALGAAFLAALSSGLIGSLEETASFKEIETVFVPKIDDEKRKELMKGWKKAVDRSRSWAD
jgi:glycerol kinase